MASAAHASALATALPRGEVAPGFSVAPVRADAFAVPPDPFLQVDCFSMAQPVFPPHPHAGFSAVTFMLPSSPGGFVNRDSRGDRSLIRPGALHWTEAASGMMHEETPIERGVRCDGFQIFVNLPLRAKLAEPRVMHLEPEAVPAVPSPDLSTGVLAGTYLGVASPVQPRTECLLLHLAPAPGQAASIELPSGWTRFAIRAFPAGDGGAPELELLQFPSPNPANAAVVRIPASSRATHVLLFAGRPLHEPIAAGGPFVMATTEQLLDARRRFGRGEMGRLAPSF